MSLDIYLTCPHCGGGGDSFNVTHNLTRLADAVGLYEPMWNPERAGITKAGQLGARIEEGLTMLRARPDELRPLEAENGWGTYEQFITFLDKLLAACRKAPDSTISVSR
jgi:hypothetical protein